MAEKIDIAINKNSYGAFDLSLDAEGDLSSVSGFDTSITLSFCSDRRADPSEVHDPLRRRGWIGDTLSDTPGFQSGSKVWLFSQAKITNDSLNSVKAAAEECYNWMLEENIATNVSSSISNMNNDGSVEIKIVLEHSSGLIEERFFALWENTGT